ncbi:MAG: hypothetical protein U1C96_13605, partial [Gallionella sp.]|nr:hypothetical protein [Gallionella sp.]
MKLAPPITAFVLFIALCISATYWTLRLIEAPQRMTAAPPLSDLRLPELGSAAGLLGGQASFSIAGNIQLKGVVVAGDPSESVAILA